MRLTETLSVPQAHLRRERRVAAGHNPEQGQGTRAAEEYWGSASVVNRCRCQLPVASQKSNQGTREGVADLRRV
jgi:hypothetical protein